MVLLLQAWLANTLSPGQRVGVDASQLSLGAAKYAVAACFAVCVFVLVCERERVQEHFVAAEHFNEHTSASACFARVIVFSLYVGLILEASQEHWVSLSTRFQLLLPLPLLLSLLVLLLGPWSWH